MGWYPSIKNMRAQFYNGRMEVTVKRRADRRRFWGGTILLLVLAAFGVIGAYHFEQRIAKECETSLQDATTQKSKNLKSYFDTKVDFMNLLTQFIDDDDSLSENERHQMEVVQDEMKADSLGVFFCSSRTYFTSTEKVPGFDFEEAWEQCIGGQNVILVTYINETELDELILCVPWKRNGLTIGMVFASFSMDTFVQRVSETVYNGAGYSLLVEGKGEILIPSNSIAQKGTDNKYRISEAFLNAFNPDELERLLRAADEGGQTSRRFTVAGDGCVASAAPLTGYASVYVVSVVDEFTAYGKNTSVSNLIVIFLVIIALFVALQGILYINQKKMKKNEIEDAVNYDELTGLPTKPYHKQLVAELIKKNKVDYAYAVCDVSGFKYLNSTFGYEYGNIALKYIAHVMSNAITRDETVSRTSGDHFALLLKYDNVDELVERMESILTRCADLPENVDGRAGKVVFTCGIYFVGDEEDVNRIRARANVARKGIRKSMTNQIAFYSEEDFNKDIEVHELEGDLVNSIKNNELIVFLQPKYGIADEKITGAEALIRWVHHDKGMIGPNIFIPIAEVNGFVKEIDFFVFETVCKKLKEWIKQGKNVIPVSVNFSRLHLNDENFVGKLIKIVKEYELDPGLLEIELTETAVYDEMDKLLDVMYLIKEAGFGLSMDDFGSGYSSLHLLREMPVDVLKLDKGFLDDCGNDNSREKKVISHVISMAKDLEISVLAEGVETESQRKFLQEANCDMIQGFYYAKPMSIDDFEKYLI